jgi:biopolymer transport protein ExbB
MATDNVSVQEQDEQVAAKKKAKGLNPGWVIPIIFVLGICIFLFVLGNPGNFNMNAIPGGPAAQNALKASPSVTFSNVDGKYFEPENFMGIIYKGGPIVPILLTCMMTVIVFAIERGIVLGRAKGKGSLLKFVTTVRGLLNENKVDDALTECEGQQGSVGNVVKEGLTTFKSLKKDPTLNKEQKLSALSKSIEEATTLEMPMLEKNMMILSTLGTVSTLIALLGTVIGMIRAFFALGSGGGSPDAAALSVGISEALINTALGISTSAIAIILYNYYTTKIDNLTFTIDEIGMSIQQSFSEFE